MTETMRRRDFIFKSAAAAAAFTILPRHVLGGPRHVSPSEKLNIAGIGIGGQGKSDLASVSTENIVALCDVDQNYAAPVISQYPAAKLYTDYRVMLDKQKDIDAVVIATPDHTHAVITLAALRAGKHVYCEKPLTHTVHEARRLAQAAREAGVVTQMGIQGHSGEGLPLVSEWIRDGAIGEVREVDAWCDLTYYPWGHVWWSSPLCARPAETPPVPKGLDWDLWIGPAPMRPYHPTYHPRTWRAWLDFGCGMMGDRGAHTLDPVVSALKLGAPVSIDATCCGMGEEVHPLSSIVTYQFPSSLDGKPVKLTWYEGTRPPRPGELEDGRRLASEGGVIFKGSKGKIITGVYGDSPRIIPEAKMQAYKRPPKEMPRVKGVHQQEWIRAIREGRQANAGFDYSGPLTETCLLGNVAKRMNTRILWDSEKMLVTNLPEANKFITGEYRAGWIL